jgi:hypothetical protein
VIKALSHVVRKLRRAVAPVVESHAAPAQPLFESLERREFLSANPIAAKIKVKNLFDGNGVSINQSLVTVPFDQKIKILDASKIQVRGYALNPITGHQKKLVIHTSSIVLGGDSQSIVINTDRLMRKNGGKILINAGALAALDNSPVAEQSVSSPQGQNKERFTLASRSFQLENIDYFAPSLFSGASASIDESTPLIESDVTTALTAFLDKKVAMSIITQAQEDAALARYNDNATKALIPDANLRAALVSLTGTVAEQAIAAYLDGANATNKIAAGITFDDNIAGTADVAQTLITHTNRLSTMFRTKFSGEPFQALSARIAHEILRQDGPMHDGLQEDIAVNAVSTLVWAQQLLVDRGPAAVRSDLVRANNDRLLAMLQSGKALFPRVGIFNGAILNASDGVFPGADSQSGGVFTSFENYLRRTYQNIGISNVDTAGNVSWTAFYQAITGKTSTPTFDTNALNDLDNSQQIITDKNAITLAGILRLNVS